MTSVLLPLPVLLPLLGAGVTLVAVRRATVQRVISISVLSASLAVSTVLLVLADRDGIAVVEVGSWAPGIGISLVADRLSATMLVVSSVVTLGVLVYAVGQGTAERRERTPLSVFYPTYLVLSAGVAIAFLSGDLFNLYVGFEVLLAASYVLLTLGGTGPRVQAGITYVIVSLMSSLVFLVGIALVYAATGTLNLALIAVRMDDVPDGTRTAIHLVLLIGFGIKAAVFPLSAWLPDSYPTAAAPVTAVFAGLLTKVGIYAIIRTETLLFPGGSLDELLMIAALLTMVIGVLGAVTQTDLKRMLSFTLVSHIGYMVFGIGVGTVDGLAGALYYVAHHILIQTALFLATGLVERRGGSTNLDRLGGLAGASPLLAVLFFVPAMNLAGIPPMSGFIGKAGLLQAGAQHDTTLAWALVGAGAVTSLLTLYAVAKVWSKAFWRPLEDAPEAGSTPDPQTRATSGALALEDDTVRASTHLPSAMVWATGAVVAVTLMLTVLGGPFYSLADRAAADLLDRGEYLSAVLPGVDR